MKTSETQNIESSLSKHANLQAEIADIQRLSEESATRLAALENTCDLGDAGALGEVGRTQILVALLPRRLAAKEQALTETEPEILKEVHNFIETTLAPKIRNLRQKAESKMKTELQPIFTNAETLNAAIFSSALISGLEKLANVVTVQANPFDGAIKYARRTLGAWEQIKTFESKIS
jgi:hypothetical protein